MVCTLTKSMVRFSWAASLFGAQQFARLLTPPDSGEASQEATEAFDAVAQTIEDQLDDVIWAIFRVPANQPKGLLDVVFSFATLRAFNPNQIEEILGMLKWIGNFGQEIQGDATKSQYQSTGWVSMSSPETD